jgi:uncharacterized protein (DUF433 family)
MTKSAFKHMQWRAAMVASEMGEGAWEVLRRAEALEDGARLSEAIADLPKDVRAKAAVLLHAVATVMEGYRAPHLLLPAGTPEVLEQNPNVCSGSVRPRGHRFMAHQVLQSLAVDMTPDEMRQDFPAATREIMVATVQLAEMLLRVALKTGKAHHTATAAG